MASAIPPIRAANGQAAGTEPYGPAGRISPGPSSARVMARRPTMAIPGPIRVSNTNNDSAARRPQLAGTEHTGEQSHV
jgi:hypothetical protein